MTLFNFMAETAPLAAAHAHARKAARETQLSNWSEAAAQHGNAAVDFARASRGTADAEALRILRLLEEQHLRLAQISKTQPEKQVALVPKSTPAVAPPAPSPKLAREMASRRGIPAANKDTLSRSTTTVKTQTQEEMELENLTLKQTLESLVGKINSLEETNTKHERTLKKWNTRWEDLRRSAQEKEKLKRERAAAKGTESPSGE